MKKLTSDIENEIKRLYIEEKMTVQDIGKRVYLCDKTVSGYLKKEGIKIGRHTYRFYDDYFEIIDSEDKAYHLGLMYADGNVNSKRGVVSIKLSEKDEQTLIEFSKRIGSKKPLYVRKAGIIAGTSYVGKKQYKMELVSDKLKEDLIKLGCVPNKSLILKFPTEEQVPREYMSHFIRGYFDGDGCIYNSRGRVMINVVGTEEFLKSLRDTLNTDINITFNIHKERRRGMSYYIFINNKECVRRFCEYIYNGCIVKMERKYKKWSDWAEYAETLEPIKQHLKLKGVIEV